MKSAREFRPSDVIIVNSAFWDSKSRSQATRRENKSDEQKQTKSNKRRKSQYAQVVFQMHTVKYRLLNFVTFCVIGVRLPSQSASEKHNQENKPTNLCAPREFLKNVR